jgi:hypothetical protein
MTRTPRNRDANTAAVDATLTAALGAFLVADKTLSAPIDWLPDDNGDLRFTRALDIDGVTQESLLLFGRAIAGLPHRQVTLGLRWTDATGRGGHFDRLDWKPMDAHTNKGLGPPELRHILIEGTHL